jgi:protein-tyrosine-phosphatase
MNVPGKPRVVFLCVHNAGRSQMAAGWLRHLAGDTVEVFSGGSSPGAETNKTAISVMAEVGIDISTEYPKPWTDEVVRAADVIVSMGCGDTCPIHPGHRYEDWDLTDPSDQPVDIVRQIRDDIRERVESLIAGLENAGRGRH